MKIIINRGEVMKNIIFDFGKVIGYFSEKDIVSKFSSKPEIQKFLINNVILSPEWMEFGIIDSGYISELEAINMINDRTNNAYKDIVYNFMINYHKYMYIQEELIDIIKRLKSQGYKIYMLSNTNEIMYQKFIKNIENLFDGVVLSYKIHKIKPYDSIYKYLIDEFNLNPEESLFIDDVEDNINTAKCLIRTIIRFYDFIVNGFVSFFILLLYPMHQYINYIFYFFF